MITMIKTKQTHPVYRKKKQGEAYQNTDNDCIPFGNLFSPVLCFLCFKKNVSVVHAKF